jgi:hypothetical protein
LSSQHPRMRRISVVVVTLAVWVGNSSSQSRDILAFFSPMVRLSPSDWRELEAGRTIVRSLELERGDHVGVFVASPIATTPERFIQGVRRSAELWRGEKVPASAEFSDPVQPSDVARLVVRANDLNSIRDCRPGDCDIKLADVDMNRIRNAIAKAGASWREAAQEEFRAIALDRMRTYRREGLRGLAPPHDHDAPVDLQTTFLHLLRAVPFLRSHASALATYVERYPAVEPPAGAEDLAYWVETSETPRPTIQALHVTIERRPQEDAVEVVVVTRQVFASHYLNGSLAVSALVRDLSDPSRRYLGYVNISATDGLGGWLSGVKRFFIERRVRGAARGAYQRFKQRLEQVAAAGGPGRRPGARGRRPGARRRGLAKFPETGPRPQAPGSRFSGYRVPEMRTNSVDRPTCAQSITVLDSACNCLPISVPDSPRSPLT